MRRCRVSVMHGRLIRWADFRKMVTCCQRASVRAVCGRHRERADLRLLSQELLDMVVVALKGHVASCRRCWALRSPGAEAMAAFPLYPAIAAHVGHRKDPSSSTTSLVPLVDAGPPSYDDVRRHACCSRWRNQLRGVCWPTSTPEHRNPFPGKGNPIECKSQIQPPPPTAADSDGEPRPARP